MMLEYTKLLVDLLKGIALPIALFAIVYLFRAQLRELLPRIRRAGRRVMLAGRQLPNWRQRRKQLTIRANVPLDRLSAAKSGSSVAACRLRSYSITSSARATTVGGTMSPRLLAIFKLTIN
jgi:hypothetical protein